MSRFFVSLLVTLLGLHVWAAQAAALQLSPQEQAWMQTHPQVFYTVMERWPQEYIEGKRHVGLSRTLLDDVERRTGLKFIYVSPEEALLQPPMMISAVNGNLLSAAERERWLWTFPWANIMPMIVGKNDSVRLRTIDQLVGQRVAIAAGSDYEEWMRKNYPGIHLVVKDNVLVALESVEKGENDAAIASGLVMLPILQRHYFDRLAISAQIPEMVSGIRIAVAPAYPELQTILNKSMENITAADAQKIYTRWISLMDLGTPTWGVILYHYRYQLLIAVVLIGLLLISLRRATLAKRQALQSEKHKSDFLNVMSHEIRTPMNAIIAALELLRQSKRSDKRQEYVELALSSSQDLLELLNSVLDHSKLSQHHLQLVLAPCELATLLEALCDSQRPAAQRKGLCLDLQLEPNLSQRWVSVDAHRVRQIINNLLSNAIKFTQTGGITLQVQGEEEAGRLTWLHFSVRDTGIGISPASQSRLFKAWEQGAEHRSLQATGSGLGLYICRSLTALMQGTIVLKSEPGQGTQVDVVLPVTECDPLQMENLVEMSLPQFGESLSVLVVEDHPANRQLLVEQLALFACHHETAEDGETALALLDEENYYDLILLDCGLPGIDGYEVARHIRELERQRQLEPIPIIAISALNSQTHRTRCLKSGMNDVLTKPIRLAELVAMLQRWCEIPACSRLLPVESVAGVRPIPENIWLWLKEDVAQFEQAAIRQDLRYMTHHIHRIRGVAQIYHLQTLAEFSEQLEQTLRGQSPSSQWRSEEWLQRLNRLTTPPQKVVRE